MSFHPGYVAFIVILEDMDEDFKGVECSLATEYY
jgi:hypothetical protein